MYFNDLDSKIVVEMSRDEFFLVRSLMSEALETGDERDFQTRVGATMDDVRSLLASFPDLPMRLRG